MSEQQVSWRLSGVQCHLCFRVLFRYRLSGPYIWGGPVTFLFLTILVQPPLRIWALYEYPHFFVCVLVFLGPPACSPSRFQACGIAISIWGSHLLNGQVPRSFWIGGCPWACHRPLKGHLGSPVWMAFRAAFFSHWKR